MGDIIRLIGPANFFYMIISWVLPLLGIIWFVRYLKNGAQERRRLRMEVSKLAEEVSLMRQQQDKE